jgi:hypothetical protein
MGDSYECEDELRKLAEKLRVEATELEHAADVLATLRDTQMHQTTLQHARAWAKSWMRNRA